eukprot:1153391-Pelagomonas_calceolata.AAC.2
MIAYYIKQSIEIAHTTRLVEHYARQAIRIRGNLQQHHTRQIKQTVIKHGIPVHIGQCRGHEITIYSNTQCRDHSCPSAKPSAYQQCLFLSSRMRLFKMLIMHPLMLSTFCKYRDKKGENSCSAGTNADKKPARRCQED